jgi:hypothetical protein
MGIVVAMTLGVVIAGSTPAAVSTQGNMTGSDGDIASQVNSLAGASQIIDDKKRFIVECPPDVTDSNTQCSVFKMEDYEG